MDGNSVVGCSAGRRSQCCMAKQLLVSAQLRPGFSHPCNEQDVVSTKDSSTLYTRAAPGALRRTDRLPPTTQVAPSDCSQGRKSTAQAATKSLGFKGAPLMATLS